MPKLTRAAFFQGATVLPLLVLVCLAIAATALLSLTLISRGIGEGRPGWILLGALASLAWVAALRLSLRRPAKR